MKETYYFPHDYNARNDPKLAKVTLKMGCLGIGIYWNLVEMLYENDGYLEIKEIPTYAQILNTNASDMEKLINDFNLFTKNDINFYSESLLDRLKHINTKRRKARTSAKKRWYANAERTQSERNAIKESKGKESKGKEIKNISAIVQEFFNYYLQKTKKNFRLTDDNQSMIEKRLNGGYTLDQLKKAVDNFVKDDWEGRADHLDLIYCIGKQKGKPDALEKWLNVAPLEKKGESKFKPVNPNCEHCNGTGWELIKDGEKEKATRCRCMIKNTEDEQ